MLPQPDANEKRRLRRLWVGELTTDEIAHEMGWSLETLLAVARSLGIPDRIEPDVYMPSEIEIKMAAASIRMSWTDAERDQRLRAAWSVTMEESPGRHNDGEENSRGGSPGVRRGGGSADDARPRSGGRGGVISRRDTKGQSGRGGPRSFRRRLRSDELRFSWLAAATTMRSWSRSSDRRRSPARARPRMATTRCRW